MAQRRKTLPPVPRKSDSRTLLDALKEIVETGEGVRGDPLDRKLTLRELVDSGIAQLKRGATGGTQGGYVPGIEPAPPNMNTPPKPEGLVAAGSFNGRIILTWNIAQDAYGNHAFTNIYRSEEDNLANAELVGREVGFIFTDYARDDAADPEDETNLKGYFYWITFTSTSGVEGPPNSGDGTYAEPIPDLGYLLELLSKNLDDEPADLGSEEETLILHAKRFAIRTGPDSDLFYPLIVAEVGGVPTVVIDTALIRDGSIQEGQLGPITVGKIEAADGSPITTVDGLIRAEAIDADNLRVAEAAKFYGDVYSGNFVEGSAGWKILQNGTVQFNQGKFNGQVEFSNVTGAGSLAYKNSLYYSEIAGSKPPTNADRTASNTSYDTARVSGSSASVVRQWALNGDSASNRVNNWVRPSTTLIDGNKIYTGDAYVDTLQIKGQAVTIPTSIYQGGEYSVGDSWTTVITLNINTSGSPSFLTIGGKYYASQTDYATARSTARANTSMRCRLVVNGTIIDYGTLGTDEQIRDMGDSGGSVTARVYGILAIGYLLGGSYSNQTVQLQFYIPRGGGNVANRYITSLVVKR